jgi:hypothetical protein
MSCRNFAPQLWDAYIVSVYCTLQTYVDFECYFHYKGLVLRRVIGLAVSASVDANTYLKRTLSQDMHIQLPYSQHVRIC